MGVLEALKTGKSTLVGPVAGALVGDLVGALVGPHSWCHSWTHSWVEVRFRLLCASPIKLPLTSRPMKRRTLSRQPIPP